MKQFSSNKLRASMEIPLISYCIIHTDGLVMRFANYEQAAAWADEQPASSKLAAMFFAFIENPFDDGAFAAITGDAAVRMYGGWTFTATFR